MTMKVDIDALLADSVLELKILGKTYMVEDIPLSIFLKASQTGGDQDVGQLHEQLALILGVKKEDLKNLGLRASSLTLDEIRKWVMQSKGNEDGEGGDAETGNP